VAAARAEIVRLRAEAIEIAKNVIRDYPNRTDALGLLGMVHNRCNEPLEALRCWEQAASRNPNRPDLFQAMARVAVRIGEYDKAAALCRRGLALSSQIPFLHCTLGEALIGLGNPAEAVGELKQATALSSGDGKSYYLLGKAYYLLEDWEQARANYEMAVGLQPGNQAVHYGLGMVYAKLGLEDQSRRSMDQYQKLQADSMEVERRGRGVAYDVATYRRIVATTCSEAAAEYAGEKNDKSEQLLRRGAQVDPTDTACRIKLAMLLVQTGRAPEAIPVCKELSGIEPKNPRHYMGLCRLYAKLQRFDDALVAAQKAAELAPDNGECRRLLEQFQGRK
jgi:tetratricopeptide (TPR) repeat protein